jgi:hypothetical protein
MTFTPRIKLALATYAAAWITGGALALQHFGG